MSKLDNESNPLFFTAIKANALFSGLCGLAMLLLANGINNYMQARVIIDLPGTGIFLMLFALWLIYIVIKNRVGRTTAWAIVLGDLLWVLFTFLLITCYTGDFALRGLLLIGFTGLVVGVFATLQALSLLREDKLETSVS